jgi:3-hydroxyisobutyrate dehydrogenase-like beta-hydroxyacid dehydrogenase
VVRVGFAGLGRMGEPMARCLLAAGFELTLHNRSRARAEPLAQAGARIAETPAALAADSDVVVTMLAGPAAVEQVVAGPDGLLAGARPGTVVVEMSTIGPDAARALARRARERGVELLDAPVSGSTPAAAAGTLACFVGGSADALARARPVLKAMTASVVHVGASGAGATVKLGLNTVLAQLNQAIAEALLLAEAEGVERTAMYDALAGSAVGAPYLGYKRAAFLAPGEEDVAFTIAGLGKDVALALAHARERGIALFGAAAAGQVLTAAAGLGLGEDDIAGVVGALTRMTLSSES